MDLHRSKASVLTSTPGHASAGTSRFGDRSLAGFAIATLLCAHAGASTGDPAVTTTPTELAITSVSVVDVEQGRLLAHRTVLIAKGRIVGIEPATGVVLPATTRRIDGRGRYLIPGLVDMHVHVFSYDPRRPTSEWTFPMYVAQGVTGVREMNAHGDYPSRIRRWNDAVATGTLVAPRILAVGAAVRGPSPAEAEQQVAEARRAGATFIKVYSSLSEPAWQAMRRAARAHGLDYAGHVPARLFLLDAARDGLRSGEHLTQVYEACMPDEAAMIQARRQLEGEPLMALRIAQDEPALRAYDPPLCERVARQLATTGHVQVPTMVLAHAEAQPMPADRRHDPRFMHAPADVRARWVGMLATFPNVPSELSLQRWRATLAIVATLHRAGVPLMAGTDAPSPLVYPGYSLHDELALLVEAGLSPAEALRAATLVPARFLDLAGESGTVAIGKRADLVLLDADPLRDIANTRRIHAVLLDGRIARGPPE
jgi:imidazolonepropionase-like amidohydrolase